jgi:uncharacterized Zn finger protein
MSFPYRPYISVAKRRLQGAKAAAKLSQRTGRPSAPVRITGRAIATTFWGSAWCSNLEAYSDYANRLPRGRTYARNGSVVDLHITTGKVEALVQGTSLYKIQISFSTLPPARWTAFKQRSSGRLTNLIDLLQGRLSKEILADLTHRDTGLFPAPSEIKMSCSCPDWAGMCKHLAAVLYGVGARLDEKPELFFTLRGVEVAELIASATNTAARDPVGGTALVGNALDGEDLSALFGVELDSGTPPVPTPPPTPPNTPAKPPRAPTRKPPVSKTRPGTTKAPGKPASGMKSKPPAKSPAARTPITSSPGKAPTSVVAIPKPPGKSRTRKNR